jgi:hypothetical protein
MASSLINPGSFQLVPDVIGAQRQGLGVAQQFQDLGVQKENQQLKGKLGQQRLDQGAQTLDSGQRSQVSQRDELTLTSLISGAKILKGIPDPQSKASFLQKKRIEFERAGLPTEGIDQGLAFLEQGDLASFEAETDRLISLEQQMGTQRPFAPVKTFSEGGGLGLSGITFNPGQGFSAQPIQLGEGVSLSAETPEQKRQRDVKAAGDKKRAVLSSELESKPGVEAAVEAAVGKEEAKSEKLLLQERGSQKRVQETITTGRDASKGIASLRRTVELLDSIKTGGLRKALLSAKQFLGVEAADEAELSANLGKSILKQLKPIFGAQFTAVEGARLDGIEANLGKSAAGNRRLLNNLLQDLTRQSNKAIDAAVKNKDFITADEIQKNLEFQLDPNFTFSSESASNVSGSSDEDLLNF